MPDDTQQALSGVPSPAGADVAPEHHMHLLGRYYRQVEAGRKTIEVRVATPNKLAVAVGDTVVFHDRDTGRELDVVVERITPYPSFEELLRSEDTARIDSGAPPGELLAALRGIYPPAKEALGVLALAFGHRPARPGRPMPMTAEEYARTVPHHTVYGCLYIRDEHDRPIQLRSVYGSRLWQFPGGNLDAPGEDPLRTARREAVEETGLELGLGTPPLLLMHFLHAGPRLPLNKVGLIFDGGRLTADQLGRIRLDPAEHDMWAVHDLATWQELMAPRAFARLDAVERARRGEGPAYLITHTRPPTPPPQEATMPAEDTNTRAWQIYGQRQLARAHTPPVPDRLDWTPWAGVGPGVEVLGDITGRRVLDIGSGAGHHAVHLAQAHGAHVTGIELSPTQHERAVAAHADVDGVEFVHADVTAYLAGAEPFDAAYAIGTLAFIDPHRSLPALRDGLRPGAPLVLSLLHTDLHGRSPSTEVAPREQMILLRDDPPLPTQMWVLAPQLWENLLTEYGFRVEAVDLFPHPDESASVVQQLIRARRLPDRSARVSSRPRNTRAPAAHAAVGVGAILLGEQGILLGRHHHGTLELPGGSVEAGESFEDAVIRELAEETGLIAHAEDIRLLGTLVDHVEDVLRVTVGALVHTWQGQPATQPDENVGDWAWYPLDQLPDGLFVCSAQILTAWRPGLAVDHPPAHFTRFASGPVATPGNGPI